MITESRPPDESALPVPPPVPSPRGTRHGESVNSAGAEQLPSELPSLRRILLPVSGLLVAQFVAPLSGTMVISSIPALMRNLEGPTSHASWIVAVTVLANAASVPIWGKLGDLYNPKRVFLVALGIFMVATIAAALAPNTSLLIAARAGMGAGLGGVVSGVAIVIASLIGPRERGRINGWLSFIQTFAVMIAPVVGGLIVTIPGLGWRWLFYCSLPFAVASFVVVFFTLRLTRPHSTRALRTDYAGAVLVGLTVTVAMIFVTNVGEFGLGDLATLVPGAAAILLLLVSIFVEVRADDPVVPFRLLARRTPTLTALAALCGGGIAYAGPVYISQYLQLGLGTDAATSGLFLVPMAIGTALAAWLAGRYMSRTGRIRPVLITGFASSLGGAAVLTGVNLAPVPAVLIGTVLVAIGLGLYAQNLVLAAQNSVPLSKVGTMSGTVIFFAALGSAVVLVCTGVLLNSRVRASEAIGSSQSEAYLDGVPWVFALMGLITAIGLVACLFLPKTMLRATL